ncbi:MAG: RNA polymerase Rpb6 [Bacteroidetes bacterium]|jgi:DNA-directed RNA polymerase subunit K/omega|nr:MAG: RNA polymerase Rpb6 [Bacteroidota bacterium]
MALDINQISGDPSIISRDIRQLDAQTGNIYEAIAIISKRANQINSELKEIIRERLEEFKDANDTLEEIIENPEQASVSIFFEKLPKPTTIAIEEFLQNKIYYNYADTNSKQ